MEKEWNLGIWATVSKYLQWILVIITFIVASLNMFANSNTVDSSIWMCVWCLSLVKIVDLSDED